MSRFYDTAVKLVCTSRYMFMQCLTKGGHARDIRRLALVVYFELMMMIIMCFSIKELTTFFVFFAQATR